MSKHTPGPWRYIQRGTQIWGKSVGGCQMVESEHLIADVRGWGHLQYLPDGAEVQDANGRLIAAAPDLLEALQFIIKAINYSGPHSDDHMLDAEWKAKKAIDKATGEIK